MSAVATRFLIAPDAAVRKFLVDMRIAAERSYRNWKQVLEDGFAKTTLSPSERRELLNPHPLEDYYFAGLIGLQAAAVRESFSPTVAEALLRQVALQTDAAVGRSDRIISNMVFIIFGRIRKNRDLGLNVPAHEVATDVILERLAIDRMGATRHLMRDGRYRAALAAPMLERSIWWNAFGDLYMVNVAAQPYARRTRAAAREAFLTRRTPSSEFFDRAVAPPAPPLSIFAQKIGTWLTPRPHVH